MQGRKKILLRVRQQDHTLFLEGTRKGQVHFVRRIYHPLATPLKCLQGTIGPMVMRIGKRVVLLLWGLNVTAMRAHAWAPVTVRLVAFPRLAQARSTMSPHLGILMSSSLYADQQLAMARRAEQVEKQTF